MKISLVLAGLFLMVLFSGCEVIEGIFKAGFWTGFLLVIVIIVLFGVIISRIKKK
jgi:hypothetical protein